jgi:hypothetical protein
MTIKSFNTLVRQSAFYSHDRINTSTPFARALGLQDQVPRADPHMKQALLAARSRLSPYSQVLPFGLVLYLTGAMSHADNAETQTGFARSHYLWPAFAGDTFKKRFVLMSLQTTSKFHRSIFRIHCQLTNQRGRVVMTCEKTMLFPVEVASPSAVAVAPEDLVSHGGSENDFLRHLVGQGEALHAAGSQVRPRGLISGCTRVARPQHSLIVALAAVPDPDVVGVAAGAAAAAHPLAAAARHPRHAGASDLGPNLSPYLSP